MHYWNKDYFEGLQRLGAAVAALWPEYAEFARLQNQGLRTSALATLSRFIERMRHEQLASRWQFVRTIYTQRHVDPRRVVPHPLRAEVILPTLREVLAGDAAPPDAFLWMAHYYRVAALIERRVHIHPQARDRRSFDCVRSAG